MEDSKCPSGEFKKFEAFASVSELPRLPTAVRCRCRLPPGARRFFGWQSDAGSSLPARGAGVTWRARSSSRRDGAAPPPRDRSLADRIPRSRRAKVVSDGARAPAARESFARDRSTVVSQNRARRRANSASSRL